MKVLVCGGRDYGEKPFNGPKEREVFATTLQILYDKTPFVVIHGACPSGADRLADVWCRVHGVRVLRCEADWRGIGKSAGPIRNQAMLDIAEPQMVIAFPGGRGTADMVKRARAAGVTVVAIPA